MYACHSALRSAQSAANSRRTRSLKFGFEHVLAKLAEAVAVARVRIEKLGRGPAPGVRLVAELLAIVEFASRPGNASGAMVGDGVVESA